MKGYYEVKLNMEEASDIVKRWWFILGWEEEETEEYNCPTCEGYCEIMCDFGEWHDCRTCEGAGILEHTKIVTLQEIEFDSNILI